MVGCHDVAGDLSQRRGAGRGNGGDGGLHTVGDTDRALGGETAAGSGDGDLAGGYGIEYHETGVAVGRLIVDLDAGILGDVDGNLLGRSSGTAEGQMADCAFRCLHKALDGHQTLHLMLEMQRGGVGECPGGVGLGAESETEGLHEGFRKALGVQVGAFGAGSAGIDRGIADGGYGAKDIIVGNALVGLVGIKIVGGLADYAVCGLVGYGRTVFGDFGGYGRKATEPDDVTLHSSRHPLVEAAGDAARAGAVPLVASGGSERHLGIVMGDEVVVVAAGDAAESMLCFEVSRDVVVRHSAKGPVLVDLTHDAAEGVVGTEGPRDFACRDGGGGAELCGDAACHGGVGEGNPGIVDAAACDGGVDRGCAYESAETATEGFVVRQKAEYMDILDAYMLQGGRGKEGTLPLARGMEGGIDDAEVGNLGFRAVGISDHIAEEAAGGSLKAEVLDHLPVAVKGAGERGIAALENHLCGIDVARQPIVCCGEILHLLEVAGSGDEIGVGLRTASAGKTSEGKGVYLGTVTVGGGVEEGDDQMAVGGVAEGPYPRDVALVGRGGYVEYRLAVVVEDEQLGTALGSLSGIALQKEHIFPLVVGVHIEGAEGLAGNIGGGYRDIAPEIEEATVGEGAIGTEPADALAEAAFGIALRDAHPYGIFIAAVGGGDAVDGGGEGVVGKGSGELEHLVVVVHIDEVEGIGIVGSTAQKEFLRGASGDVAHRHAAFGIFENGGGAAAIGIVGVIGIEAAVGGDVVIAQGDDVVRCAVGGKGHIVRIPQVADAVEPQGDIFVAAGLDGNAGGGERREGGRAVGRKGHAVEGDEEMIVGSDGHIFIVVGIEEEGLFVACTGDVEGVVTTGDEDGETVVVVGLVVADIEVCDLDGRVGIASLTEDGEPLAADTVGGGACCGGDKASVGSSIALAVENHKVILGPLVLSGVDAGHHHAVDNGYRLRGAFGGGGSEGEGIGADIVDILGGVGVDHDHHLVTVVDIEELTGKEVADIHLADACFAFKEWDFGIHLADNVGIGIVDGEGKAGDGIVVVCGIGIAGVEVFTAEVDGVVPRFAGGDGEPSEIVEVLHVLALDGCERQGLQALGGSGLETVLALQEGSMAEGGLCGLPLQEVASGGDDGFARGWGRYAAKENKCQGGECRGVFHHCLYLFLCGFSCGYAEWGYRGVRCCSIIDTD